MGQMKWGLSSICPAHAGPAQGPTLSTPSVTAAPRRFDVSPTASTEGWVGRVCVCMSVCVCVRDTTRLTVSSLHWIQREKKKKAVDFKEASLVRMQIDKPIF